MANNIDIRVNQAILAADSAVRAMLHKLTRRLQDVERGGASLNDKMYELQAIMKDVRAVSATSMACQEGCNSCCHMRVLMSQAEANAIGAAIGVTPITLPKTHSPRSQNKFGKDTPCTFLNSQGKCDIYDHRPVMCINHVNMDLTPKLCTFEHWDRYTQGKTSDGVPALSYPEPVRATYQKISHGMAIGDIRTFFPQHLVPHLIK